MSNKIKTETVSIRFNRGVTIIRQLGNRGLVESMTYKRFKALTVNELDQIEFTVDMSDDKPERRHNMLKKLGYTISPANEYTNVNAYSGRFAATKTA